MHAVDADLNQRANPKAQSGGADNDSRHHLAPHFSTANRYNFQLRFTAVALPLTIDDLVGDEDDAS